MKKLVAVSILGAFAVASLAFAAPMVKKQTRKSAHPGMHQTTKKATKAKPAMKPTNKMEKEPTGKQEKGQ